VKKRVAGNGSVVIVLFVLKMWCLLAFSEERSLCAENVVFVGIF